ncbi:hypothetical protein PG988_007548 [Apiospora saccharicola]
MKFTFAMTAALAAAVLAAPMLPAAGNGNAAEARSLDHYNHNIVARDGMTAEQYAQEYDEAASLEARGKLEDLAKKLGNLAKDKGKKLLGRDGMTAEAYAAEYDEEHPEEAEAASLEARGKLEDLAKKLGNLAKDKGKKLLGRDGMTAEAYAAEYDETHPEQTAQDFEEADAASLEARGKLGDLAKKLGNLAKDKGKKLLGRDGMTAEAYAAEYDETHPEEAAQEPEAASLEARGKLEDAAKKLAQLAKDKGKKLLGARDGMTAEAYAAEYDEMHPEEAAQ